MACLSNASCRESPGFSDLQCACGYEGNLCGVCAHGYGYTKQFTCRACMSASTIIAFFVVSAVVMLGFMKWLVEATAAENRRFAEADEALILPADLLRPLLLYSQYIMVIGSIAIPFPDLIMAPLRALAWFWAPASPETLSIDCLLTGNALPMAIQRTLFYLGTPFAMLFALLILEAAWVKLVHKGRARATMANRLLL